jgi:hypothetical protein
MRIEFMPTSREIMERLDARHDELIHKLDDLNAQIERALAEIFKNRAATSRDATLAAANGAHGESGARRAA